MKLAYAAVFEQAPNNYSAYVPDVPGCTAADDTLASTKRMLAEALEFLFEFKAEHGEEIPPPQRSVTEAMQYHIDLGGEDDEDDYQVVFDLVEVDVPFEIELPQPAAVEA